MTTMQARTHDWQMMDLWPSRGRETARTRDAQRCARMLTRAWPFKLLLAVFTTVVLLVHMRPMGDDADRAAETALVPGGNRAVRVELVCNAGAALLVLRENTTLSVYEPRGLTRCGQGSGARGTRVFRTE